MLVRFSVAATADDIAIVEYWRRLLPDTPELAPVRGVRYRLIDLIAWSDERSHRAAD